MPEYDRKLRVSTLRCWKPACICFLFLAVVTITAPAQTFTTLVNFDGSDGDGPSVVIQATDGNFYGTASGGGICPYCGTVFKITPSGTLTTLYTFCAQTNCADGDSPFGGVIQATDGNFYGTTSSGWSNNGNCPDNMGCGTIFKITAAGNLTTLYSFCTLTNCIDGWAPDAGLVQGADGNFYGTTNLGGAHQGGTVYKITPAGELTTLYSFCAQANCTDGYDPNALIRATDGNFYGTTISGGAGQTTTCEISAGCGTVFKITPDGELTVLHRFNGAKGTPFNPEGALTQGSDGNFYGTTVGGGTGWGTVFKITPWGKLTILHIFSFHPDGAYPDTAPVQGTDGSFYGTASIGGQADVLGGTIYKITPTGAFSVLHSFCAAHMPCGTQPAGLVQGTDGTFYGTASVGGTGSNCDGGLGCGTIFSLSVGLSPFVEAQNDFGIVGGNVIILGNNLTGATAVSFNGTAATFTVNSATYITAEVPAGATTGNIEVTTPSATLTSNPKFHVIPQVFSFSPTSGPAGTTVTISGESFTQAGAVALAYKYPMTFTVNSDTQITATIPASGTTGEISVRTPGGIAHTAAKFTVTP
jgi:uncharacterized repeat protein (TIGR03803 family)